MSLYFDYRIKFLRKNYIFEENIKLLHDEFPLCHMSLYFDEEKN